MTTKETNQPCAVTSIADLKAACGAQLVELPGFEPGTTITLRLRRANLRAMAKTGSIPNTLLAAAQRLYEGAASAAKANFADIAKVMDTVVAAALVEPTMEELNAADVELTEEQFGLIWAYSQRGAAALAPFRAKSGGAKPDTDGQSVERAAK